jgi:hypothetical protein
MVNSSGMAKPALILLPIVAALTLVSLYALTIWPRALVDASGIDGESLSPGAYSSAIGAARVAILTALGGLAALIVAFATFWEVGEARAARFNQKAVEWSIAFAQASERLSDVNPTARIAGVVSLSLLRKSGGEDSERLVRAVLASYVRTRVATDQGEYALSLALQTICNSDDRSPQSLSDAVLSSLDLSGLNFDGIVLDGVSFRDATLSERQRAYVARAARTDMSGVNWVAF